MVIVTVKSNPKAEYQTSYLNEFNKVAIEVRNENGCLEYELYRKESDDSGLFLFERWESKEALEAHLKTEHMIEFIEKTKDWFEFKEIKVYEAV